MTYTGELRIFLRLSFDFSWCQCYWCTFLHHRPDQFLCFATKILRFRLVQLWQSVSDLRAPLVVDKLGCNYGTVIGGPFAQSLAMDSTTFQRCIATVCDPFLIQTFSHKHTGWISRRPKQEPAPPSPPRHSVSPPRLDSSRRKNLLSAPLQEVVIKLCPNLGTCIDYNSGFALILKISKCFTCRDELLKFLKCSQLFHVLDENVFLSQQLT